jgi:hypothetical protein
MVIEIPKELQGGEAVYCSNCHKDARLLSAYKGDWLDGKRLPIPKNECWKLCSQCGNIVTKLGGKRNGSN